MIDILQVLILGIVQGVTEFVPVSSSGHLVILHEFVSNPMFDTIAFDVSLHVGTLLALIIYFYRDLAKYCVAGVRSLSSWRVGRDSDQTMAWLILISMVPAGFVGYFFEDIIATVFRDVWIVIVMLVIGALLFFAVERWGARVRTMQQLSWRDVLVIGLAQAVALIPGTSRSGITITAGMALNLTREAAARFSFLMSVPIIAAAGAKKMIDLASAGMTSDALGLYLVGALTAAVCGYAAIHWMLRYLQTSSLRIFAWYRLVLAAFLVVTIVFA